jgi:hypothetical protein
MAVALGLRVFWAVAVVAVYVVAISYREWWLLPLGLPALLANIYIWWVILSGRVKIRP